MSIYTIPIEILNEIISFLAVSFDDQEPEESIEDGKSISLVSRAFRPIGQALRWRYLVFDLRSAPSLAQHFELYPHLTKLVRFIDQRVGLEVLHLSNPSTSNFRSLVKVLSETGELRGLKIDGEMESIFEEIFRRVSSLEQLGFFSLYYRGTCDWTPKLTGLLLYGFPRARTIELCISRVVVTEDQQETSYPPQSLKQVDNLVLMVDYLDNDPCFLDLFDLSVLRTCHLGGPVLGIQSYGTIARCQELQDLYIHSKIEEWQQKFSEVVAQLPNLRFLEVLNFLVDSEEEVKIVDSEVNLMSILTALPPNLLVFSAWEVSFDDYESIPLRQIPESPYLNHQTFEALHPSTSGYRSLLLWKETEEEGQKWYRSIRKGTTGFGFDRE